MVTMRIAQYRIEEIKDRMARIKRPRSPNQLDDPWAATTSCARVKADGSTSGEVLIVADTASETALDMSADDMTAAAIGDCGCGFATKQRQEDVVVQHSAREKRPDHMVERVPRG